MELKGSLGGSRVLELLQGLSVFSPSGRLTISDSRGPQAVVVLAQGKPCAALLGHLQGEEALLACFFWYEGTFAFETLAPEGLNCQQAGKLPPSFNLATFALNAVYIADELEKRSSLVPADDDVARLQAPFVGEDPFDCGLREVYEALEKGGAVTVRELEQALPLAPIKIRLALAYLVEKGVIPRSGVTWAPTSSGKIKKAWARLASSFGGGVRVFLVVPAVTDKEHAARQLSQWLREKLEAPPWLSLPKSGPCFVRFRPEGGGVLTVCVMSADELQSLPEFVAFASAYDVIVCATGLGRACMERQKFVSVPIISVSNLEEFATHFFETLASVGK